MLWELFFSTDTKRTPFDADMCSLKCDAFSSEQVEDVKPIVDVLLRCFHLQSTDRPTTKDILNILLDLKS